MTSTGSSRKGGALAQFRQVYCWQLKKNRMLSIVYGAMTLLCCTIVYLCQSIGQYRSYFLSGGEEWSGMSQSQLLESFSQGMADNLNQQVTLALIPLSLVFLVVFLVTAFGYMHRRRSVDLFHALPVRRTPLLLGSLCAGYTVLVLVVVGNSLLCGVIGLALGATAPFTFPWLLCGMGYLLLLLAAAMVLTLFLLVASGTMVNAVLSGVMLSLSWPILCFCGAVIIQMTLPGSTLTASAEASTVLVPYLAVFVPFLGYSNSTDLLSGLMGNYSGGDEYRLYSYDISPLLVVWWCVFTVLLLVAAVQVYRRRKSECAENNFSFPALRMVIQFLVSAAFGLGCGVIFGKILNQNWVFFLAVLIGSAVAHVVSQIIWVRGLRQFKRSLPAYGALMASLCVFFVGLATGGLGYVSRIPSATEVESIAIQMPEYHYDDSLQSYLGEGTGIDIWSDAEDGSNYLTVTPQLTSEVSIKTVEEMHQAILDRYNKPYLPFRDEKSYYSSCVIQYQLSDGKVLQRQYQLPDGTNDGGEKVSPTGLSEETVAKMAAVIAQDEYQAYNLYYYQNQDRVVSVKSERSDVNGDYRGEQKSMTTAQRKALWNTFQKELESDRFRYTAQESSGIALKNETRYYVSMEPIWPIREWPDALKELLMDQTKKYFSEKNWDLLTIENGAGSDLYVPESCTKTRKLIEQYIGDNVEFVPL